jgi:peptidoglycan/xylan/chitin deacetylase (PgdA/CDA1 family)
MHRNVSIIVYHHVTSEVEPLTANLFLSTRPEIFRSHVKYFAQNFDIIGVDDLLAGRLPRKPLLLTFDDAYRSIVTEAAPILAEFSAPSLFFIIPSVLTEETLPIDNLLSLAVQELGAQRIASILGRPTTLLVAQMLSNVIAQKRRYEIAIIKSRLLAELGISESTIRRTWKIFLHKSDLKQFSKFRIEVGNHSRTHTYLRSLSLDELDFEIAQGREQLQRLSSQVVRCLSVPFGNWVDLTNDALAVARSSGHEAIFLVHARSNKFRCNNIFYRTSLRNEGIQELRFAVQVLPLLRSVRHSFRWRPAGT